MPKPRFLPPALAAATLALSGAVQAVATPTFDISVSDMNAADWAQVITSDQGPATITYAVSTLPAAPANTFWQATFASPQRTAPSSTTDVVANVFRLQGWDPATQGAVERLDVVMDLRGLSSGFSNQVVGFVRPVIEQGGRIFSVLSSDATVTVGPSFNPTGFSFEDSAAWRAADGSAALPDFSAQGATLHFGYRLGLISNCNGSGTCAAVSSVLGVDNFRVDVIAAAVPNAVPEPALPALLLAGLAAGWSTRRRR